MAFPNSATNELVSVWYTTKSHINVKTNISEAKINIVVRQPGLGKSVGLLVM
jgi:hypothetical protein